VCADGLSVDPAISGRRAIWIDEPTATYSAASIPANLAEGCARGSDQDFARFVQIAMGSAAEVEYHLLLAKDLGYIGLDEGKRAADAIEEVKRMLASLLKTVRK
jgi:four helix bundle protein